MTHVSEVVACYPLPRSLYNEMKVKFTQMLISSRLDRKSIQRLMLSVRLICFSNEKETTKLPLVRLFQMMAFPMIDSTSYLQILPMESLGRLTKINLLQERKKKFSIIDLPLGLLVSMTDNCSSSFICSRK